MTKPSAAMYGGLEVRVVKGDEKTNHLMINHHYVLSHVAQFAMELFRQEMVACDPLPWPAAGDGAGGGAGASQPYQRTSVDLSVKRACDGAERLFAEMNKRRWLVKGPSVDELVETPTGVSYGMHGSAR